MGKSKIKAGIVTGKKGSLETLQSALENDFNSCECSISCCNRAISLRARDTGNMMYLVIIAGALQVLDQAAYDALPPIP